MFRVTYHMGLQDFMCGFALTCVAYALDIKHGFVPLLWLEAWYPLLFPPM